VHVGKVGADVSEADARVCAELCALNALAAAASVAGGLDAIHQVVKVVVYVASAPDFFGQPAVANGASELLGAVFGDAGQHARSAVGAVALPLNAPVEVDLVVRAG
jgi:enamine deaminase RidA (YjgF/YER057c/UK114 family)